MIDHMTKICTWIGGRLHAMKRGGVCRFGFEMDAQSLAAFNRIESSGFRPTLGEVMEFLPHILSGETQATVNITAARILHAGPDGATE